MTLQKTFDLAIDSIREYRKWGIMWGDDKKRIGTETHNRFLLAEKEYNQCADKIFALNNMSIEQETAWSQAWN